MGVRYRRLPYQAFHRSKDVALSRDPSPLRILFTLMSSSISGQWMPDPFPVRVQLERSSVRAWDSRGYHDNGIRIDRPSESSASSESSETCTFVIATSVCFGEEIIPRLLVTLTPLGDGVKAGDVRNMEYIFFR